MKSLTGEVHLHFLFSCIYIKILMYKAAVFCGKKGESMDHEEKRRRLIRYLLDEKPGYRNIEIPTDDTEQKRLLRSLFNVRVPRPISDDFLKIQDEYLQEAIREKGITDISDLTPQEPGIYIWQGDITTLGCDAIVNAANSGMTGCYQPCHGCIDNCIHTYAGIQLRNECNDIMVRQGFDEPTGQAKITGAYNLPCRYVIHTVGPIVQGWLTKTHEELLASCYRSCLELAERNNCRSIAFCCISTGVFGFPQKRAAEIAVQTVREYKQEKQSNIEVIFNVFKDEDKRYYEEILR